MTERKHKHPFIVSAIRKPDIIQSAVDKAVELEDRRTTQIDWERLNKEGPEWFKNYSNEIAQYLNAINSDTFWQTLIEGVQISLVDYAHEGLVSPYATDDSLQLAQALKRRNKGLDIAIPALGIAILVGRDIGNYIVDDGKTMSTAERAAYVVGKELYRGEPSADANEYIARLSLLFPPQIEPNDLSAFDILRRFKAFEREGRICEGIGLARQIFMAYGSNLSDAIELLSSTPDSLSVEPVA